MNIEEMRLACQAYCDNMDSDCSKNGKHCCLDGEYCTVKAININSDERIKEAYDMIKKEEQDDSIQITINSNNAKMTKNGKMVEIDDTNGLLYEEILEKLFEKINNNERNDKIYEIEDSFGYSLIIQPKHSDYKDNKFNNVICLSITNEEDTTSLEYNIEQAKEIIVSLQEIIDYVEGE